MTHNTLPLVLSVYNYVFSEDQNVSAKTLIINNHCENTFANIGELLSFYVKKKQHQRVEYESSEKTLFAQLTQSLLNEKDVCSSLKSIIKPYLTPEDAKKIYFELILFLERQGAYEWVGLFQKDLAEPWIRPQVQICAYYLAHRSSYSYSDLSRQFLHLKRFTQTEWMGFWSCFNRLSTSKPFLPTTDGTYTQQLLEVISSPANNHLYSVSFWLLAEILRRNYTSQAAEKILNLLSSLITSKEKPNIQAQLKLIQEFLPESLRQVIAGYKEDLDPSAWILLLLASEHQTAQKTARAALKNVILTRCPTLNNIIEKAPVSCWKVIIHELLLSTFTSTEILKYFLNRYDQIAFSDQEIILKWAAGHTFEEIEKLEINTYLNAPFYKQILTLLFEKYLIQKKFDKATSLCLNNIRELPLIEIDLLPQLIQRAANSEIKTITSIAKIVIELGIPLSALTTAPLLKSLELNFRKELKNENFSSAFNFLNLIYKFSSLNQNESIIPKLILRYLHSLQRHTLCIDTLEVAKELDVFLTYPNVMQVWSKDRTFFSSLKFYISLCRYKKDSQVLSNTLNLQPTVPHKATWINSICDLFSVLPERTFLLDSKVFIQWINNNAEFIHAIIKNSEKEHHLVLVRFSQRLIKPTDLLSFLQTHSEYFLNVLSIMFLLQDTREDAMKLVDACLDIHVADLQTIDRDFFSKLEKFFSHISLRDPLLAEKQLSKFRSLTLNSATNTARYLEIIQSHLDKGELDQAANLAEKHALAKPVKKKILAQVTEGDLENIQKPLLDLIQKKILCFPLAFQLHFYRYLLSANTDRLFFFEKQYLILIQKLALIPYYFMNEDLMVLEYFLIHTQKKTTLAALTRNIPLIFFNHEIKKLKYSEIIQIQFWKNAFSIFTHEECWAYLAQVKKNDYAVVSIYLRAFLSINDVPYSQLRLQLSFATFAITSIDLTPEEFPRIHAQIAKLCNVFAISKQDSKEDDLVCLLLELLVISMESRAFLNEINLAKLFVRLFSTQIISQHKDSKGEMCWNISLQLLEVINRLHVPISIKILKGIVKVYLPKTPPNLPIHPLLNELLQFFTSNELLYLKELQKIFLPVFERALKISEIALLGKDRPWNPNNFRIGTYKPQYYQLLMKFCADNIELLASSPSTEFYILTSLVPLCGFFFKLPVEQFFELIDSISSSLGNKKTLIDNVNCNSLFLSKVAETCITLIYKKHFISDNAIELCSKNLRVINQSICNQFFKDNYRGSCEHIHLVYLLFSQKVPKGSILEGLCSNLIEHLRKSLSVTPEGIRLFEEIHRINTQEITNSTRVDSTIYKKCESIKNCITSQKYKTLKKDFDDLNKLIENLDNETLKELRLKLKPLHAILETFVIQSQNKKFYNHKLIKVLFSSSTMLRFYLNCLRIVNKCLRESQKIISLESFDEHFYKYSYFSLNLNHCLSFLSTNVLMAPENVSMYFESLQLSFECRWTNYKLLSTSPNIQNRIDLKTLQVILKSQVFSSQLGIYLQLSKSPSSEILPNVESHLKSYLAIVSYILDEPKIRLLLINEKTSIEEVLLKWSTFLADPQIPELTKTTLKPRIDDIVKVFSSLRS